MSSELRSDLVNSSQPVHNGQMKPPQAHLSVPQVSIKQMKKCFPKMSKREKRFDPAKATVPSLAPEKPLAFYQHLPHRQMDYFQGMFEIQTLNVCIIFFEI